MRSNLPIGSFDITLGKALDKNFSGFVALLVAERCCIDNSAAGLKTKLFGTTDKEFSSDLKIKIATK